MSVERSLSESSPTWLTCAEAAHYCRCGPRLIYRAVRDAKLRAARVGLRGDLRFKREFLDSWLESLTEVR